MRSFKEYIVEIVRKPPMLFPLVGLFHVLWFLITFYSLLHEPFDLAWLSLLWMVGYTIFWIGVCDLKRWGAWGYIALTLLNIILYVALKTRGDKQDFVSPLFLIDGLFSFFVMFYYKRFE